MIDRDGVSRLSLLASEMRRHIIEMMGYGKAHHFGGSLSCVEIITALYFYIMRYDPKNPNWIDRDRFVMSKGHSVPAQYAALGMMGVIPIEKLNTLKQFGSILQGHPNAHLTPGVEAFTGSLGQGLSFANGIALAARIQNRNIRVYVLLGDGECMEGQVWEAAMTASTHELSSITAIIDNNNLKSQGRLSEAKELEPLASKWEAFGWQSMTVDGHDLRQICNALDVAKTIQDKPTMIIAQTVKGKGVSFMEDHYEYHNSPISKELWNQALQEICRRKI